MLFENWEINAHILFHYIWSSIVQNHYEINFNYLIEKKVLIYLWDTFIKDSRSQNKLNIDWDLFCYKRLINNSSYFTNFCGSSISFYNDNLIVQEKKNHTLGYFWNQLYVKFLFYKKKKICNILNWTN